MKAELLEFFVTYLLAHHLFERIPDPSERKRFAELLPETFRSVLQKQGEDPTGPGLDAFLDQMKDVVDAAMKMSLTLDDNTP